MRDTEIIASSWRRYLVTCVRGLLLPALLCGCESADPVSNNTGEPRLITFGEADPLADFDARMAQPRIPLDVDGTMVETCAELFTAIETGADFSYATGFRWFADYNECFELPLLCDAQVVEQNRWRAEGLAEHVYRRLDLGTFGSSLWPRRTADSHRYSDFDLPAPEFSANGFSIETEDWYYGIQLVAIADFDGNGVADVLATFVDDSKRASYFDYSPIILSRDAIDLDIRGQRVISAVLDGTLETWPDNPMTCDRAN